MGRQGKDWWEERAQRISNIQPKLNRIITGHSRKCFISHLRSHNLTDSSALPPSQRIPAGFEPPVKNPFPSLNELCWIPSFPLMFVFFLVYSSLLIYKKKKRRWHRLQKISALTNIRWQIQLLSVKPTTKDSNWIDWSHQGPRAGAPAGMLLQLHESEFKVTISGRFMGLYLGYWWGL